MFRAIRHRMAGTAALAHAAIALPELHIREQYKRLPHPETPASVHSNRVTIQHP